MKWNHSFKRSIWTFVDKIKRLKSYPQFKNRCCCCRFSLVRLCASLWTVACQAPLSMGISRQEYCSGLPCPPPRDLPDPGIKPTSFTSPALAGRFCTTSVTWEAHKDGQKPGPALARGTVSRAGRHADRSLQCTMAAPQSCARPGALRTP